MLNPLKFLCLGLFLSGALSNQNHMKHTSNDNCDQQSLSQLIDITQNQNPLCAKWDEQKCVQCASQSYFNQKGLCTQVDPLCKTFNYQIKRCIICYPGYQIKNGYCVVEQPKAQQNYALSNPLCANWENKKCTKCSPKSYFNSDRLCVMASPDCKTFSQLKGNCLSCFEGFQLDQYGKCFKVDNDWKLKDPLCSKWGNKGICLQCAPRTFRNFNGLCQQVDPNCDNYSQQNGECLSCYKGFSLRKGKCLQQNQQFFSTNPYCAQWQGRKCISCSQRAYFNKQGTCIQANPLCKAFSERNGQCTSCYPGYKLDRGVCNVQNKQKMILSNPLCAKWDNEKCTQCSNRSYFNSSGICAPVDATCASFNDKNGLCLSCYKGYDLQNGKCIIGNVGPSQADLQKNPLCSQWKNKKCTKCAFRSYFNQYDICTQIDPYCKIFSEQKKVCTKCYVGYKLRKDQRGCIFPGTKISQHYSTPPSIVSPIEPQSQNYYDDKLCGNWQSPTKCKSCSVGSYMNNLGRCVGYDKNCKLFNPQLKLCQQCYDGWQPFEDKCLTFEQNSSFSDQKCSIWKEGRCLQCVKGLSLNVNGSCNCP